MSGYLTDGMILTGVDELLELLKNTSKISVAEAAQKLDVNPAIVQSWVDFLVEEEIVGIEYKFTKPIIYLNKPPREKEVNVKDEEKSTLDTYKDEFKTRAQAKNIPQHKIGFFWKHHVHEIASAKRDFFFREARKRGLSNIEGLYNEYLAKLTSHE